MAFETATFKLSKYSMALNTTNEMFVLPGEHSGALDTIHSDFWETV